MQLAELYSYVKKQLQEGNIPEFDTEARVILREIASLDTATIMGHPDMDVDADIVEKIIEIVDRRLTREPLQYILGKWNFMGLDLFVGEDVLIPRPDTEILVETAMQYLHDGMRILDLCTGTGCVLISLLHYSNGCTGTGVDISEKAVSLSRKNVDSILGEHEDSESGDSQASIVLADLYDGADGVYDIIVSNPPYIATDIISTLEPEVKDFEPMLALDGGVDGLDLIKRIIDGAFNHLTPGGPLLMEIGFDQGESTVQLMRDAGFIEVSCIKDYAGLDRVVVGTRPIL